jgi:hypothetical protein
MEVHKTPGSGIGYQKEKFGMVERYYIIFSIYTVGTTIVIGDLTKHMGILFRKVGYSR